VAEWLSSMTGTGWTIGSLFLPGTGTFFGTFSRLVLLPTRRHIPWALGAWSWTCRG